MGKKYCLAEDVKDVSALQLKLAQNKQKNKAKSFDRSHRVRKKADFSHLRQNSKKWPSRHWVLFFSKNTVERPRLAITVTSRYGNAVARNIFKRWIREKFRLHKEKLPFADLHFVAKQKAAILDKKRYIEELNEDFERLLHRFHSSI